MEGRSGHKLGWKFEWKVMPRRCRVHTESEEGAVDLYGNSKLWKQDSTVTVKFLNVMSTFQGDRGHPL